MKTSLKNSALLITGFVIAAGATNAFGFGLITIPTILTDTSNEGRAITPDGRYVVGVSGASAHGFLYNVASGTSYNVLGGGAQSTIANGVGYRTSGGQTELLVSGFSSGFPTEWMTTDGGVTWGNRRRNATMPGTPQMGTANQLGSQLGSDVYYVSSSRNASGQPVYLNRGSGAWVATVTWDNKGITAPDSSLMNGVSAIGRAVGRRGQGSSTDRAYVLDWASGTPANYYINTLNNGLNGGNAQLGAAWAVSQDGTAVFGRSFLTGTGGDYYSFRTTISGFGGTHVQGAVNALPELAGTGGSVSRTVPYGASADGRFAVGMDYVGTERAALWYTEDNNNPGNWRVLDLTTYAQNAGILDGWIRLTRAYSVGVDPATGDQIATGVGVWSPDGGTTLLTRAWIMQIPEPTTLSLLVLGGLAVLAHRRRK
jgi:hypothetical protein